jgi:N-acyl-D-aspartate/D-glutamate deacylase
MSNERKVTSLRDLPQGIAPPRDLWAGIEARINAERQASAVGTNTSAVPSVATRKRNTMRWMAMAAVIAALAVGMWIGRSILPTTRPVTNPPQTARNIVQPVIPEDTRAEAVQAAFLSDPKYRQERAALVKSLEAKLASMPPDTRAKVLASLATIQKSKQDLEDALGKDPTNALLQELLVNTYQDEMRVLTTVHDADNSGEGT